MSKNPHERKRKEKLAAQRRRERDREPLAYSGEKYKKEEFIPTWMHTETGIYQAYVVSGRKINDKIVVVAIEKLIRAIRANKLPPLSETETVRIETGHEEDLIIDFVRRSWKENFSPEWKPSADDFVGVLRSILGSIENVKSPGSFSQSYLKHIEGFLSSKLGITVRALDKDFQPLPEPKEDELTRLGHAWTEDRDPEARAEFFELASHLIKNGQASRVYDTCCLLMGEIGDSSSSIMHELGGLIRQAHESLVATMG
jgi:hypothetical protein